MTTTQQAQAAYNEAQALKARMTEPAVMAMYGQPILPAICNAELAEVVAHFEQCELAGRENGCSMHAAELYGKSAEEIADVAAARGKRNRKGAGARALRNKYGTSTANDIIRRAKEGN
jgi:hypothetical protein